MVKAALPVALILFLPFAAGLTFDVNVAELTDHSLKDLEYSEEVPQMQEINATVENIGSIGCTYRLKADFEQGNESFERFSSPESLWQGENSGLGLHYIPMNYTGMVDTNLSIQYCGQEKKVEEFSFNVTNNTLPQQELESRTVESTERTAEVEVSEGEMLVPEEEPSYWKTSSSRIINESATVEYDAPIFDASETITYSVIEDEEVIGRTTVELEEQPTLLEKLRQKKLELVGGLLIASIVLNLLLLLRNRGLKFKLPDYQLPDLRKQD